VHLHQPINEDAPALPVDVLQRGHIARVRLERGLWEARSAELDGIHVQF
jgi:hypothetical protein